MPLLLRMNHKLMLHLRLSIAIVYQAIAKSDVDVRRELYSGILLTGGTSLLSGLRDRLERDLLEFAPQACRPPLLKQVRAFAAAVCTGYSGTCTIICNAICWRLMCRHAN